MSKRTRNRHLEATHTPRYRIVRPKPRPKARWATRLLAGVAIGAATIASFTPSARAQDKPGVELLAQGPKADPVEAPRAAAPKPDPELAKLPKVSIEEMERYDKESEQYRKMTGKTSLGFYALVNVSLDNVGNRLVVSASICDKVNCGHEEKSPQRYVVVRLLSPTDSVFASQESGNAGKVLAIIDLDSLNNAYRKITGKDIEFVKLVVERGIDPSAGAYVQVHVVPVAEKDGEIKSNTPILLVPFTIPDRSLWEESQKLIAMN